MYRVQVTGLCLVDSSARQPCKLHPPLWRCRSKTCLKTAYPSGQLFGRIQVISKIKQINWLVVFVLFVEFCIFSMGLTSFMKFGDLLTVLAVGETKRSLPVTLHLGTGIGYLGWVVYLCKN
ncbi:hypothetical protein BKA60DRAFT_571367 [Fusarium oxysporum]|nr:hypothetical protein BKA60DRAFT_571367 [Fusarium oxysporum]